MLAKTLEINWHDGQAIYSIDFSPDGTRYATAGADASVRIWSLQKRPIHTVRTEKAPTNSSNIVDSLPVNIDFLSELKRHSSPVNVVRFSPNGKYLASAGDDACIILWKMASSKESSFGGDYSDFEKESWVVAHMFHGHNKEVYDLAWSPCGNYFITASIDNTARVWCLQEKMCLHVFADHTHYVQGVTWDPLGQFIATQSSDRSVAIYKYRVGANGKIQFSPCSRRFNKLDKGKVGNSIQQDESASSTGAFRLYHDENLVSFFRRLCFSPDGALLVTPAGLNKTNEGSTSDQDDSSEDCQNCAYIYPRNTLVKHPIALIGSYPKPSIAVRWCTTLYEKRAVQHSMFNLDYRMVYAVASQDSVYIYDTQQARPLCAISGMHFAPITDLTWSHDGSILMFASADGYCSAVVFGENELGKKYSKKVAQQQDDMMDIVDDNKLQQVQSDTSTPAETKAVSTPTLSSPSPTIDDGNLLKKRLPNNDIQNATDKPKKRRITPILVSSNI